MDKIGEHCFKILKKLRKMEQITKQLLKKWGNFRVFWRSFLKNGENLRQNGEILEQNGGKWRKKEEK